MKEMMKRTTSLVFAFLFLLIIPIHVFAQSDSLISEERSENTTIETSDQKFAIVDKVIDGDTAQSEYMEFWYQNLPTYNGNTFAKNIDVDAIKSTNNEREEEKISSSIAAIQIVRLAEGDEGIFRLWKEANLTSGICIYNLDESLYGYAFGVVDKNNKLVGYLIAGASEDVPPILEYSYDPSRFILMENASKVYFHRDTGILLSNQSEIKAVTGDAEQFSTSVGTQGLNINSSDEVDEDTLKSIHEEWEKYKQYAEIASLGLTNSSRDSLSEVKPTASATATQTRLPINTSDHTWLTICSYTTMSMYFDAIGRRIEPALLGTVRPHSIQLNRTLHSKYGCNPSFGEIAEAALDWANEKKLTSALTFTKYHVYSSNYSAWTKHKTQIDKEIPTMVGYSTSSSAHIMMGIGYTSDNFYIVRDTWTQDNKPMNSTFYYNKDGYTFRVLGLDYSNSNTNTAWGNVTLRKGDSNLNVRRLKIMLTLLYYNPGSVTSYTFDDQTEAAVKAFQTDQGLSADGVVGSATYTKLKNAHIMCFDAYSGGWRVLANGMGGDDVAQLQIRLYRMGYLDSTCDGLFGADTEAALRAYQASKGLTADGIAGSATFAKLYGTSDNYIREYLPCSTCIN